MKKVLLIVLLTLGIAFPLHATTLSFSPQMSTADVGDMINVDIMISDLGTDDDLAGFDLSLTYDPTILGFKDYSLTNILGTISSDADADAEDWSLGEYEVGTVGLSIFSYLPDFTGQPDSFTLATVTFEAIAAGTTSLEFSDSDMDLTLTGPGSESIAYELTSGSVRAVPEPATFSLLGMALLAVAGITRRK